MEAHQRNRNCSWVQSRRSGALPARFSRFGAAKYVKKATGSTAIFRCRQVDCTFFKPSSLAGAEGAGRASVDIVSGTTGSSSAVNIVIVKVLSMNLVCISTGWTSTLELQGRVRLENDARDGCRARVEEGQAVMLGRDGEQAIGMSEGVEAELVRRTIILG